MHLPSLGGVAKIIGLFSIGKSFIDKAVFQRLLQGIAAVVGLSVIAGVLVSAIVIGLLGLQYYTMISSGMTETNAIIITALTIGLILAIIVYKIIQLARKIATFSTLLAQTSSPVAPVTDAVTDIVQSFVSGFKQARPAQPQSNTVKPKKYPKAVK